MWVGIGCGGLFLLSAIGGGLAWYFAMKAAEKAASEFASGVSSPTATPTDGSGTATGGSGTCAKAAACCKKVVQKTNAGPQAETACGSFNQLRDVDCQTPLNSYIQSAKLLGTSCD